MGLITGKDAVVFVKGTELDLTVKETVSGTSADELDATVYGNTGRKFLAGFNEGSIDISALWESGAGNSAEVMGDIADDPTAFPVTVVPEGLTVGKRAFVLKAIVAGVSGPESSVGAITPVAASLKGGGGSKWGQLLLAEDTTASGDGAGQDNPSDAATTKGARFVLHLTANTRDAGTLDLKIQDSADGAVWADLAPAVAFTQVAAGATSAQVIEIPNGTTLRRHVRVVKTVTGGTTGNYKARVAYSRNF